MQGLPLIVNDAKHLLALLLEQAASLSSPVAS